MCIYIYRYVSNKIPSSQIFWLTPHSICIMCQAPRHGYCWTVLPWSEATDCCLSRYIKFWMSMILIWYKKHHNITQRNKEIRKTQECPLQAILEDRLQDFGSTKQTKASEYFHFAWTLAPSVGPREVAADNAWRQVAWKLENDFDSNSGSQSASEAIQHTANTGWKMQTMSVWRWS